jgi:preprotein translocase subunit SecE
MEENQNTENEKKKVKKNGEKKLSDFWNAHKSEFKKITWPSRDELLKQTVTVIVISLIVGGIIFVYDSAISYTYEKSINLVKNAGSPDITSDEAAEEETSEETTGLSLDVSDEGVVLDEESPQEATE